MVMDHFIFLLFYPHILINLKIEKKEKKEKLKHILSYWTIQWLRSNQIVSFQSLLFILRTEGFFFFAKYFPQSYTTTISRFFFSNDHYCYKETLEHLYIVKCMRKKMIFAYSLIHIFMTMLIRQSIFILILKGFFCYFLLILKGYFIIIN